MLSELGDSMYCRKCRYHLKALPRSVCPECGTGFDPDDADTYLQRSNRRLSEEAHVYLAVIAAGYGPFLSLTQGVSVLSGLTLSAHFLSGPLAFFGLVVYPTGSPAHWPLLAILSVGVILYLLIFFRWARRAWRLGGLVFFLHLLWLFIGFLCIGVRAAG